MKFRKKPVEIEAIQWDGFNVEEMKTFITSDYSIVGIRLYLKTLESDGETQLAMPADWIIKGVKGEFYPCKPDVFEQTYEAV